MLHFYRSWDGWTNILRLYIKFKESWQVAVLHEPWLISKNLSQVGPDCYLDWRSPESLGCKLDWDVVQAPQMQSPFYSFQFNSREPAEIVNSCLDWTACGVCGMFHMTDKSIYAHNCFEVLLLGIFPGLNVSIQSISFLLTMLAFP